MSETYFAHREWQSGDRICSARYAADLRAAQPAWPEGRALWLRAGAMRLLHGAG